MSSNDSTNYYQNLILPNSLIEIMERTDLSNDPRKSLPGSLDFFQSRHASENLCMVKSVTPSKIRIKLWLNWKAYPDHSG